MADDERTNKTSDVLETNSAHTSVYQRYRANLLSPSRVRQLSRLRPARAILDTLLCWVWIVAAWTACAIWPRWWVVALAIPVVGCRYYGLFILGHDAMHRRIFNSIRANDLFADLFMFAPIGAITRINNWNHLEHHRLLATEVDPDRHKYACFGKADYVPFASFLIGLKSFLISARHVFSRDEKLSGTSPNTAEVPRYTVRDTVLLIGWQAGLIGGLSWAIGWWAYPTLWLVPGFLFAFLADNLRTFAEHSQPRADALADEHRLITYISNPIERLFLAPFNMNYHTTHHLWPSIPYYNLPEADCEIRQMPASRDLEWRTSYVGYLVRYFLALPLEECKVRPAHSARG